MLSYPFEGQIPDPGELVEVAPGVHWLRMPLPMALDHINLYLLEDTDGWWIVDSGISSEPTETLWEEIFAKHLGGKPVKGVAATHWHPDHTGMAGWLCERWRVPFYITRTEYLTGILYTRSSARDIGWVQEQHQRRMGRGEDRLDAISNTAGLLERIVRPFPGGYKRLVDGTALTINGHRWRVLVGRGHSPEHACFYCDSLNVLISGDQVIPRITSNISVPPEEPDGNPLRDWLQSLERFLEVLPADALVLPAHNEPFYGLHHRLRFLIDHHEDNLLAVEEACVEQARTALELLPALFRRDLSPEQVTMALGECLAHLNYLLQRGQVERSLDAQDRYLYRSIDDTLSGRLRQRRPDPDVQGPMQV